MTKTRKRYHAEEPSKRLQRVVGEDRTICSLCKKPGLVQAVEKVPGNGILYECIHEDGKMHEWQTMKALRISVT